MRTRRFRRFYSTSLLILGIGIGNVGTLLVQNWITHPPAPALPQAESTEEPRLTSDLLLKGEPRIGSDKAPLTIVEFSDFECPYCKLFHEQVLPKLKKEFVDTGFVRFIHKDLPLPFHEQSRDAAAATRCAAEQNKYWVIYTAIFDQQTCLKCKGIDQIIIGQNIDSAKIQACMKLESIQATINANISEAELHNIRATPTFVIGPTRADDRHRGNIVEGLIPWPQFKLMIIEQLKSLDQSI